MKERKNKERKIEKKMWVATTNIKREKVKRAIDRTIWQGNEREL